MNLKLLPKLALLGSGSGIGSWSGRGQAGSEASVVRCFIWGIQFDVLTLALGQQRTQLLSKHGWPLPACWTQRIAHSNTTILHPHPHPQLVRAKLNAAFNEPVSSQFIHSTEQPQLPRIPGIPGIAIAHPIGVGGVCVSLPVTLQPLRLPQPSRTVVSVITKFNEWIRHGPRAVGGLQRGVCVLL